MPCANRKQWDDGSCPLPTFLLPCCDVCGLFFDWLPGALSYRGICERSRIVWITDVTCRSISSITIIACDCDLRAYFEPFQWFQNISKCFCRCLLPEADSCLLSLPSSKWFRGVSRRERGPTSDVVFQRFPLLDLLSNMLSGLNEWCSWSTWYQTWLLDCLVVWPEIPRNRREFLLPDLPFLIRYCMIL